MKFLFKKIKRITGFIRAKWFKGSCPHFCATCPYKSHHCYEEYLNDPKGF